MAAGFGVEPVNQEVPSGGHLIEAELAVAYRRAQINCHDLGHPGARHHIDWHIIEHAPVDEQVVTAYNGREHSGNSHAGEQRRIRGPVPEKFVAWFLRRAGRIRRHPGI